MEGAGGTHSRLLLVLALVAGLLVGGTSAARAAPQRALAPAPTASPTVPGTQASGAPGAHRTVSRSGGAERAAVPAPSALTACGGVGGAGPLPSVARLPDRPCAAVGPLPRPSGAPPAVAASAQQDRAPPRPTGPQVP